MILRDNQGKIVGQLEHFRDNNGNTVDTNTIYDSRERPKVQQISIRDSQGHVESRTILNGKLLP
jgi:hypothetical protein